MIVECAKFALERMHAPSTRGEGESSFVLMRPRASLELAASMITEERPVHHASPLPALRLQADLWSPSLSCGLATPPPNDISLPHTPLAQVRSICCIEHMLVNIKIVGLKRDNIW